MIKKLNEKNVRWLNVTTKWLFQVYHDPKSGKEPRKLRIYVWSCSQPQLVE